MFYLINIVLNNNIIAKCLQTYVGHTLNIFWFYLGLHIFNFLGGIAYPAFMIYVLCVFKNAFNSVYLIDINYKKALWMHSSVHASWSVKNLPWITYGRNTTLVMLKILV